MIHIPDLLNFLHNIGSAAEESGTQGWLPSAIGGAFGGLGNIMNSAVHTKIQENAQKAGTSGDQNLEDRANKLW
ncbi:MAG: hypothetical protein UU48_C0006G0068 [Candidatus Uhrbacteria bacterium GW2011_GWF2_41_16]|uniref:Uncharacterized protein n=2 Tax=Candidatus Uhriibacteriota TaxID=1752732 RepID=A0A0G0VAM0_9BACT|nr:MAG: hypothetical protein UU35_C0007G0065 [Candidatus Uhrbacteria bacterium GW2011_GWC2_41_11]KKR98028.1 MAG: hypothetical protein UU48_C0006G0068 [Candidatus Uhrbacteria bacterium GW2011_GWF2_41_16]